MSLFGVVSRVPLRVRTTAVNGDGWGFSVDAPERRLAATAHSGGGGTVAVHDRSCEWFVSDDAKTEGRHDRSESIGDVVVAAVTAPAEKATLARSVPWVFVYEGTIAKGDALCAALDPGWVVSPRLLRRPGTMIFAHFITHLASVGRTMTAHSAMAKATADLRRARSLGSATFLCSDGSRLYAYAWGRPLCVSNMVGVIVVGSPEVMPDSRVTQHVPNDSLVALQREPQLGWALVQRGDDS